MKYIILSRAKFFIRLLRKFFALPPLIIFFLTTEQNIIIADAKVWTRLEMGKPDGHFTLGNLLTLLAEYKEFRSLYYHRIYQGNLPAILLVYTTKFFYREAPLLFISKSCNIGQGLFIQHGFSTIIIADIGENCWINQQVTIGFNDATGRRPTLGNNVRIGAGAKILGGITLGDDVTIGANAVVVKDVPANCVVVGVPAYIIKKNGVRVMEKL